MPARGSKLFKKFSFKDSDRKGRAILTQTGAQRPRLLRESKGNRDGCAPVASDTFVALRLLPNYIEADARDILARTPAVYLSC